jgi:hypothetical protein
MSFREKIDWLSFCTMCLFSIYFFEIARGLITGSHISGPDYFFKLFGGLVFVQLAIQVVAQVLMAIRSPQDAKTPADERERLIEVKAIRPAYALLFVGCLLTIGTMNMGLSTWQFAQCILFAIWMAELLRYGTRLYYHRRAV